MYSVPGDTTSLVPGFPIRTSSDPRSVDSSPRHIAASHVLHRLPVPRHPPCALKHLHTKQFKNSRKNQKIALPNKQTPIHKVQAPAHQILATTIHKSNTTPHHQKMERQPNHTPSKRGHHLRFPTTGRRDSGPVASKPNSVSDDFIAGVRSLENPNRLTVCCAPEPPPLQG
jgi:hypothetical protein